jgi:hypothetical protein
VDRVWHRAQAEELDILPLVCQSDAPLARNRLAQCGECRSFPQPRRGPLRLRPDARRDPSHAGYRACSVPGILELASRLTTDLAVIEFIAPDDSMFQRLTRGRAHLHKDLTREVFEATLAPWFAVEDCQKSRRRQPLDVRAKTPGLVRAIRLQTISLSVCLSRTSGSSERGTTLVLQTPRAIISTDGRSVRAGLGLDGLLHSRPDPCTVDSAAADPPVE